MTHPAVSVVIPTLNAGSQIATLLNLISSQTVRPLEILVVDSASDDNTKELVAARSDATLISIARSEFNHGLTRDMALRRSKGDYVCFLTQDAIPQSDSYIEKLIAPLEADSKVALVSGRQLPRDDARRFEELVREFNYPAEPSVKSMDDLVNYGIKTFFASDVCSVYRKSSYLSCGGFGRVNTNEDMLMAAKFIAAGLKVAYEPEAAVYHSHNLTPSQQFNRNKEVGYFLATHSDALMHASEIGEGGKLVKNVSMQLIRERRFGEFICFGIDCCARLAGNRAGRALAKKEK